MPIQQGKKLILLQRRQRIADLYVQGHPQHAIASDLGIPQTTVWRDLQAIRKEWRQSTIRNFDEQVERELQKLDLVEREAWEAWERSKKPAQEAVARDNDPTRGTKRMKSRHGDTRCLDLVLRCSDSRRELLGLNPHKPQVAIQADTIQVHDQAELRRQLLNEPHYLDYLRQRAINADAGTLRAESESRPLEAGTTPGLPGPRPGGYDPFEV